MLLEIQKYASWLATKFSYTHEQYQEIEMLCLKTALAVQDRVDPTISKTSYIKVAMENTAKDYMSKEKKLYNREAPLDFASKVASSMDAFERIELDSVIDSLGFPDSTIIKMMMDGYDYTDMGKVLNMSQTAIATRVHRNKSKWQDYLSKSLNG